MNFLNFFDWPGKNIINDAVHNKGLGYSGSERDRLELRGMKLFALTKVEMIFLFAQRFSMTFCLLPFSWNNS